MELIDFLSNDEKDMSAKIDAVDSYLKTGVFPVGEYSHMVEHYTAMLNYREYLRKRISKILGLDKDEDLV